MSLIQVAMDERYIKSLDLVLEGLWIELSGDSLAESDACVANVNAVIDMFKDKTLFDIDSEWLERQLDKLYAVPNPLPIQENQLKVNVMTVHQSKGLEFDYVFIVGSTRKSSINQSPLVAWSKLPNSELSVLACNAGLEINEMDKSFSEFIGSHKRRKELEELKRVAYVAVTRGVKKVFISGKMSEKEGELKPPMKSTLLGVLFNEEDFHINVHNAENAFEKTEIKAKRIIIQRELSEALPECHLLANYRGKQTLTKIERATDWMLKSSEIESSVFNEVKGWFLGKSNEFLTESKHQEIFSCDIYFA